MRLPIEKIHLSFTEKKFVEESVEIISIFVPRIEEKINKEFFSKIDKKSDKFKLGKKFVEYIFSLRYPVLYEKIKGKRSFMVPYMEKE